MIECMSLQMATCEASRNAKEISADNDFDEDNAESDVNELHFENVEDAPKEESIEEIRMMNDLLIKEKERHDKNSMHKEKEEEQETFNQH